MDPSSRLPLELLQKIFRHYLSDRKIPVQSFDPSDGVWIIGQVNSTWRCATLSDASLWSTINAAFTYPSDSTINSSHSDLNNIILSNGIIECLACVLSRSRDIPLSLSLHFPIRSPENAVPLISRTFFSLLMEASNRFQSLDLVAPTPIWEDFARIPPDLICCCPILIDLSIRLDHRTIQTHDDTHVIENSVQMPQLRRLAVHVPSFLDHMTARNLKSLTVKGKSIMGPLADFLDRSKCALTDFDVSWHGTVDELFIILSSMPTLESLTCRRRDLNMSFYERMKLPSTILPRLRSFSLRINDSSTRLLNLLYMHHRVTVDAVPIIDMVESRLAGGVLENVDISYMMVNVLSEDSQRRLSNLNALPHINVEIEPFSVGLLQSRINRRLHS
ncbi:uncharacterized protein EV420DRAFT_1523903 [Desarmillaria tabescens]|uniref:F-box domain-containing protein n=1 Tax=Armillaria tabescens TaxID=1929756 RepID=A0AA39NB41_ARMTA|nr:uncharacterized protein EV420DRAFT_1523903 [Desarmillaria tabescens]KAK0462278.1 hypothetical protein EV420DRAFT_1523903 [Desarmillaria tabescens]